MPRILVIDDDEPVRRIIRRSLEAEGHEVLESRDGAEGLRAFHNQPIDLVISDIFMPNQEGLETIRVLLDQHPDLPVIAISGGGSEGGMDFLPMAKMLGARHTFSKPFLIPELLAAVRESLAGPSRE